MTRAPLRWLLERSYEHPRFDLVVGGAVAFGYWCTSTVLDRHPIVLAASGRHDVYQAMVEVSVGVLAFGVVPPSIALGVARGPRLAAVVRHHRERVRKTFVSIVVHLCLLIPATLTALVLDTGDPGVRWVRYALLGAVVSATSAVIRLIDVFSLLLGTILGDQSSSEGPTLKPIENRKAG